MPDAPSAPSTPRRRRSQGQLRRAFDETARQAKTEKVDAALIAAGRKIADRVDEATVSGEGQEVTKALYLVPHLVNILREMLATPAARQASAPAGKETGSGGGTLELLRGQAQDSRRGPRAAG